MGKRVVLIAGASGGIGKACVKKYNKNGWIVVALSRNIEQSDLKDNSIDWIKTDCNRIQSIENAVNNVINSYGQIDSVVHSIGDIFDPVSIEEMNLKRWKYSFDLCVGTAVKLTKGTIKHIKVNSGSYIFISSVASVKVYPGIADYCSMKAALTTFSKCLAEELSNYGGRSNCISPAVVNTPLFQKSNYTKEEAASWHKLKRIGEPEEVADVALFLSNKSGDWITGQDYIVDGGMLL